jgi:putative FmdB family regulatory protein
MPIYEYRCNDCQEEFSQLFLNSRDTKNVKCKFCRSRNLTKLVSAFRIHQTEESRLTNFDTSKPRGNDFYKDSRNIGLWQKKG